MDTNQSIGKRRRASKSTKMVDEATPTTSTANMNGEKSLRDEIEELAQEASKSDKSDDTSGKDSKVEESQPEKPTKGRKRKASDMKGTDSSSEEPPAKDKAVVKNDEKELEQKEAPVNEIAPTKEDEKSDKDKKKSDGKDEPMGNDSSLETPETQSLGKGKRARIPNKRYSDFPLKSFRLSNHSESMDVDQEKSKTHLENGELKENESGSNSDVTTKDDVLENSTTNSPNVSSKVTQSSRLNRTMSPLTPASKRSKTSIPDLLSNPNYLKPFDHGWRRELVYRATSDSNSNKRNGDIYYYTPNGRKVRSMREVSENLSNSELTLDDFTFFKEPLGLNDPDKEIIRDAKLKTAMSTTPHPKKATPKLIKITKVNTPKVTTPAVSSLNVTKAKRSPRRGSFKIKLRESQRSKSKIEKKKEHMDLEVGTYPPNWQSPSSSSKKPQNKGGAKSKKTKRTLKLSIKRRASKEEPKFMHSYLQNVAYGYHTLLYVFQYLKVQELLRAGCVCTMWRDIASHPSLWRTVRMKNSTIHSFDGLTSALEKHGTVHLDLRKMLLPAVGADEIWQEFSREIKKVESLRKIELSRCPATVVEQLALTNPKLQVINAVTVKCENISLAPLVFLKDLLELRLKSTAGFTLTSDLTALADLKQLKHLSLTSIKDLNKLNIDVIADLKFLESLDLGECCDFPKTFGSEILTRLTRLEKLRLEKGQGQCYTFEILEAVKTMPHLEQLELVNFDIKTGFDRSLGACTNIKKLLIIPTYISQSATTNHMVLGGVLRLQTTLLHFVWGVTLELLRVTELFVDQCEDPDKKDKKEKKPVITGDSIPVLKPVPLLREGTSGLDIPPAQDPPQVEILPLPNLQKLLLQSLPTTRVKILKIPFHATWRQSITDAVN